MNIAQRVWVITFYAALLAATISFLSPRAVEVAGTGPAIPQLDKIIHVMIFLVLAVLAARAHPEKPRWGIFAALVFYGACIEIAQAQTGRTGDVFDLAADALGGLLVFAFPRVRGTASPAGSMTRR